MDKKILAIVGAIVAAYWYIFVRKTPEELADERAQAEFNNSINELAYSGNLTYPENEYSLAAQTLYIAMDGIGTDFAAIYNIFNKYVRNVSDFAMLVNKFGMRDGESLFSWLKNDLSNSELNDINNLLATNGINVVI